MHFTANCYSEITILYWKKMVSLWGLCDPFNVCKKLLSCNEYLQKNSFLKKILNLSQKMSPPEQGIKKYT